MSDKPKRRFWQIHLSTAIVMMFTAGGLMWINLRPVLDDTYGDALFYERGFPFAMNDANQGWQTSLDWTKPKNMAYVGKMRESMPSGFEGNWFVFPACWNAVIAMAAIGCIAVFWEGLLRRREDGKL